MKEEIISLINNNKSLLILDKDETYLNKYYNQLKENDYNILTLNLIDLDKSCGYNPLSYSYCLYKNGDVDNATLNLTRLSNIIFKDENNGDPFWIDSARDLFVGVTLQLFEDGEEDEINLNSVFDFLKNGTLNVKNGKSSFLTMYFNASNKNSVAVKTCASTIVAPIETQKSIIAVTLQKLKTFVVREKLLQVLRKSTFDFNDLFENKIAIFVIPREEGKSYNILANIFIEELFEFINLNKINNFSFILDDLYVLGKLDYLENMLNRSNNSIKIVKEENNQLIKLYGEDTYNKISKCFIFKEEFDNTKNPDIIYSTHEEKEIKVFNMVLTLFNLIIKDKKTSHKEYNGNNEEIKSLLEKIDKTIEKLENEKN